MQIPFGKKMRPACGEGAIRRSPRCGASAFARKAAENWGEFEP
ncbi:hypothetical protein SS05631_c04560 [Sinorhizobium sp. CCBAU 05631]|nr:hypothetical protein SS05631_c04560 [Sinorhizobium sp. CCBAU 05631]